jgi:hypothetical protein
MLIAMGTTALAMIVSTIHWAARPHLFTILFTVLFLWILERAREGGLRGLLSLPLLTILWANLHGGFIVGLVLVLAYAAGEIVGGLFGADGRTRRDGFLRSRPYLATAAGCLAGSLVNPQSYKLHVYIYKFLSAGFVNDTVVECLSFNFHQSGALYFEAMLACAILSLMWSMWRGRWEQAILIVGWTHLALYAGRNLPLFAVIVAPTIAAAFDEVVRLAAESRAAGWLKGTARELREIGHEYLPMDGAGRFPFIGASGVVFLLVLLCIQVRPPLLEAKYDSHIYPVAAIKALRSEDRIFTTDLWGGYLIYRLYPNQRVFIDGRFDFYGGEFLERYLSVLHGKYDWEKSLRSYGIDTVLLPVRESLVSTLKASANWRPVYDDGIAIVFRRKAEQVSAENLGGVSRGRQTTKPEFDDLRIIKYDLRGDA